MRRVQMATAARAADARIFARPSIGRLPALIVMLIGAATASVSEGALFTSTTTGSRVGDQTISVYSHSPGNPYIPGTRGISSEFYAGYNSVGMSADTTTDRGQITSLDLIAPFMAPTITSNSFDVDFNIVEVPANFPDPAVIKNVAGTYTEKITYTGIIAAAAPTLNSSQQGPFFYIVDANHFSFASSLNLTTPSFTVLGTYEVIGPHSSISIPFSKEYTRSAYNYPQIQGKAAVPGGPGFADGFDFDPFELLVYYEPTSPTIFDGTVDDVPFFAEIGGVHVNYFAPEPSAFCQAAVAMIGACGVLRRRVALA